MHGCPPRRSSSLRSSATAAPLPSPTGRSATLSTLGRAGGASVGAVCSGLVASAAGCGSIFGDQLSSTPRANLVFVSPGSSGVSCGSLPMSRCTTGTPPCAGEDAAADGIGEEPAGLTAASLKHLRRQRDRLVEEKGRLQVDLTAAQALAKEQRERAVAAEAELKEARLREAALREELVEARAAEAAQRERAAAAELSCRRLEESLAVLQADFLCLREALERQCLYIEDLLSAPRPAPAPPPPPPDTGRIEELEGDLRRLRAELQRKTREYEDMRTTVAGAMVAAEQAVAVHAAHAQHIERLRAAKLAEAINEKVELHISVPRVTLNYNNAPPLLISAASGLNDTRIRDFLHTEVFPKFEPLWVRMDKLDIAPDGTSKRTYAAKMLDKLTEAVKCFVKKSQQADELAR